MSAHRPSPFPSIVAALIVVVVVSAGVGAGVYWILKRLIDQTSDQTTILGDVLRRLTDADLAPSPAPLSVTSDHMDPDMQAHLLDGVRAFDQLTEFHRPYDPTDLAYPDQNHEPLDLMGSADLESPWFNGRGINTAEG